MRKSEGSLIPVWAVTLAFVLPILSAAFATASWDVAPDFHTSGNTSDDTWQFFQVGDGVEDGSYELLSTRQADFNKVPGLNGWRGRIGESAFRGFPFVLRNTMGSPLEIWGTGQGTVPAAEVTVHPWSPQHVAIGWKSPITGQVDISGRLYVSPDTREGGNGVDWFLDRGSMSGNLASGTLAATDTRPESGDTIGLSNVPVKAGGMLYLIVHAKGDAMFDAVNVALKIQQAGETDAAQLAAGHGVAAEKWQAFTAIPEELKRRITEARESQFRRIPYPPASPPEPDEPETRDLTAEEATAALHRDWLFQADNKPTVARARHEIKWARELAARLSKNPHTPALSEELAELGVLEQRLTAGDELAPGLPGDRRQGAEAAYLAVRRVKRSIMFKNPVVDFSQVLFIEHPYSHGREWPHQVRHRNGMMAIPGGRQLVLDGLHPGGHLRKLGPESPGAFWRPDVSFDARRVLFCYKAHDEKSFHLYEINLDGSGMRQLTFGEYDDIDPIYMPDGHIMFATTRCNTYVRCMPYSYCYVLARCDADGENIYLISRNSEPDWCPSLLNDGRVIYSRWEYHDKALWRIQSLWVTGQDGTGTETFWGNQSVWPDHLAEPRAIPGSRRVMFTGLAHHDWFAGSIGIIDPEKGANFPHGLTKVTCDVPWPECGTPPLDPHEAEDYHRSGAYTAYKTPYPLSEEDFLVSARSGGLPSAAFGFGRTTAERAPAGIFKLYLMDVHGNRELILESCYNVLHAVPVRARPVPPVQPDRVAWPGTGKDRQAPEPGVLYTANVYQGLPDLPPGSVKYLRVLQMDARTYSSWLRDGRFSGPVVSHVQDDGVKRILGTVPIREDGSVAVKVPAGRALHFQLLDEHYRALHTMRSFTGVMPGEQRGCVGCHEQHSVAPVNRPTQQALQYVPVELTAPPWGDKSISYEQLVQPVLDRYCGKCHQGDGEARKDFDLTLRPAETTYRELFTKQLSPQAFKEPYLSLIGQTAYSYLEIPNQEGIAGAMKAEDFAPRTGDPSGYKTLRPMTYLSYTSRLIEMASSGTHYDVKVDPVSLRQLIGWVDSNCPYRGEEEIRAIADPDFPGIDMLPIRPRVKTAPIIPRP